MFHLIPGSRLEGSDLLSCSQTTEVILNESPPERSRCMHMDK